MVKCALITTADENVLLACFEASNNNDSVALLPSAGREWNRLDLHNKINTCVYVY